MAKADLPTESCNQIQPRKDLISAMAKDTFHHITPEEKSKIESSFNPLIITDTKEQDLQFYEISSPFAVMFETCRETDDLCNIYQFSPDNYHNIEFGTVSAAALSTRPQHQHSCIEFMYVLSGSVTNHVGNQVFTYEAGQCCIMNKNIRHCEEFSGDFQAVFLMLRDDFTADLLADYTEIRAHAEHPDEENLIFQLIADSKNETLKFDKIYLDCFPMIPADDILDRLSALFNTLILETINWDFGSSFLVKAVFARLLRLLGDPDLFSINRIHSHSQGQEYLFSKISRIMRSSHGRCTREELEMLLHYNGEYLNRIVKKQTGKTILEYGQSIYLEEARQLLSNTDKSISSIIEELGFSNRSHFYRLFKNAFGETPLDYRKRLRPRS